MVDAFATSSTTSSKVSPSRPWRSASWPSPPRSAPATRSGSRAAGLLAHAHLIALGVLARFRPVRVHGRWLVDGALANPIPVSVCRAPGARYVFAVSLAADSCGRGTVVPHLEAASPEEPIPEQP